MIDFGKGLPLQEACPALRDPQERLRRILDVAERDSVIEGLPPFSEDFKSEILRQSATISALPEEHLEQPHSLADNS